MVGKTVSSYDVIAKAGEGGMGVVYRARDRRLGREVALKFLFPEMLRSVEARTRFEREARLISSISHPNVATLFSYEESEVGTFLVFEYLPGGTLADRMPRRNQNLPPVSLQRGIGWAVQIADGLAHAHRKGIVHRDIKPANVLFDADDRPKLSDFGLAKAERDAGVTRAGVTVGTAAYMAPEQAIGADASPSSDIYSFGVLLYELFSGQRPFAIDDSRGVFFHILESQPDPPRTARPDLPEALNHLILRMIAKKPVERPATMDEVLEQLKQIQAVAELSRHTATATNVLATAAHDSAAPTARALSPAKPAIKPWIIAAGVAAALLAVLALSPARNWLLTATGQSALPEERKLAVLMFENLQGGPEQEAFCDGLTDSLTAAITQMGQSGASLWVVPASEVRDGEVRSIREARKLFAVNLAITGSLRRLSDSTRVTLNLVDAERAKQMESRTIEVASTDLPSLEPKMVEAVAAMLRAGPGQTEGIPRLPAGLASSAYEHFLQGRGFLPRFDVPGNLDRATASFEKALQLEPNYAQAMAALGEAYLARHTLTQDPQWLAKAQTVTQRAIELDPRLAPAQVNLSALYARTSRFTQAIAAGRAARDLDPLNADAYRALAQAYSGAGQNDDAERTYRQAIDLRPGFWLPYKDLGVHYLNLGKFPEAESMFRSVIEKTPDNEWGYRNLATVFHFTGRFAEAETQLQQAVARKPTGEAYSNLGTIFYVQGRFEDATGAYTRATELSPTDPIVWGNLGDALRATPAGQGRAREVYSKALELGERQLGINAKDPQLLLGLALYSAKLGDHAAAGRYLGQAKELIPGRPTLHYQSAIVEELAGKRAESLRSLQQALASGYPVDEVAREPELAKLREDERYKRILTR